MSILLGDNFSYQGAKPLDGRLKYDTVAAMKAMADSTLYDGCLAYCVATDKTYQWKSTNEVDEVLGKWREFESGGGAEYTAGDGIDITDGKISTKNMLPDDMAEVASPMPGVMSRLPVLFDESGAERVVGWYKYANGTKKPVYEKTYMYQNVALNNQWVELARGIYSNNSIDKVVDGNYIINRNDNNTYLNAYVNHGNGYPVTTSIIHTPDDKFMLNNTDNNTYMGGTAEVIIMLRYTKTTDTAS